MRYRILEYNDDGEWQAAGIMADVGRLVRFQGDRISSGPKKSIEEVGPEDFPGSWEPEELRVTEVREVPEQPSGGRILRLLVELLQVHRPELSRK